MPALVSVVIPVYNSQEYLADCIDSVLVQTYPHFEVIVIDDGSTDSTAEIIETYQNNEKFKLLRIKNSGQSVARNMGIEHAKGKYVIFIDSDDCWTNNTLQVTVSVAEKMQLDMVLFDAELFIDDKITDQQSTTLLSEYLTSIFKPDTYIRHAPEGVFSGQSYLTYQLDSNKYFASPVLYLYKLDTFKDIRFVPGIIHEDNAFTMELLVLNGKVQATHQSLYRRRIRKNSVMTSPKSMKNVVGYLGVIKRMSEVYDLSQDRQVKKSILRLMAMMSSGCTRSLKQIDVENT